MILCLPVGRVILQWGAMVHLGVEHQVGAVVVRAGVVGGLDAGLVSPLAEGLEEGLGEGERRGCGAFPNKEGHQLGAAVGHVGVRGARSLPDVVGEEVVAEAVEGQQAAAPAAHVGD